MQFPKSSLVPEDRLGIATDLYELTMALGYFELGKQDDVATFDLFLRRLPPNRSYVMVAGLEQGLHYLTNAQFTEDDIDLLRNKEVFGKAPGDFWDYLRHFRFSGEVWAMPEGTIAFANEPLMIVEGPIIEAQIAETFLLSCYTHQTKIATKAARCVEAAQGRPVIEFGTRRTDVGAALRATRASYIGGAVGTSSVLGEALFGIPSFGTHAHSWVMSFDSEREAFEGYQRVFGRDTLALIDTYDTIEGARKAAELPGAIAGVRIDSGDLTGQSKEVRRILDAAGKLDAKIFATGNLDEYKIEEMLLNGAKVDIFGVGTELVVSGDAPSLDGVYKLSEMTTDGRSVPKLKLSKDKATLPGRKQVYRSFDDGLMDHDMIALREEISGQMEPLLVPVMRKGHIVYELPELETLRSSAAKNRETLPLRFRKNRADPGYPVKLSPGLEELTSQTRAILEARAHG